MPSSFRGAPAPPFPSVRAPLPARLLATIAAGWARSLRHELPRVLPPGERAHDRVLSTDDYDVWVIHWAAGSGLDPHDHAASAGALRVVHGELVERQLDPHVEAAVRRHLVAGHSRTFPVGHVHEVRNRGDRVASSVHVYSPP